MSTAIKSFGQGSNLTVSAYENGNATVVSSFGPKSCLRLKADASMYSKSGGSIQIRGIGQKTFLHAKELFFVQPIEFRLRNHAGDVLLPNQYCDFYNAAGNSSGPSGATTFLECKTNTQNTDVQVLNALSMVSNGWFKSCQNVVLSLNGASWQVQPSSMIDSFEKVFAENRYDEFGATSTAPYTSAANPRGSALDQPGYMERCQNFMKDLKVISVTKTNDDAQKAEVTDVCFSANLVSRIPIGPLFYAAYPSLSNVTENDIHCLPHIHDLSLEYTLKNESPNRFWFKYASTDANDALAVDCSDLSIGDNTTGNSLDHDGQNGIDMAAMWSKAVSQTTSIANDPSKYLNLQRPYLSYVITEVSGARLDYKSLYTIPSLRFTTYSQDQYIPANDKTNTMAFEYIQIDNLASLICVSVFEAERDGAGGSVGPRQARWRSAGDGRKVTNRRGAEFQNISCPIRWDTLKCNMSVQNAVLGSMTGGIETEMNQYNLYLKFSKSKVSFSDWRKFNQMILISPQELLGGGLGLVDQQVSLSISFEFERCACDTMLCPRDWCRHGNDPYFPSASTQRGIGQAINYTGRLWFMHQEAVKLSAGQCGIEQISFTADEAVSAFKSVPKTLEAPVLDQFVN